MLYDAGLIISVALGAWLALDVGMAEGWRRRSVSLGMMGAFGALWAASELLLRGASEPADFALCRRLLYLAVSGATFSWFWVGVEADSPEWFQRGRWRISLAAVPLVGVYACLLFGPDGSVISLYTREVKHGPGYVVATGTSWTLIVVGLYHFTRAALRLKDKSALRTAALGGGILIPVFLNMLYATGQIGVDPAPALLGPTALMIRFAVIDPGLAMYLPLARSDVIEQLAVGVVVLDIHDRIVDANSSARTFLATEETNGLPLHEALESIDSSIEVLRFPLRSHHAAVGSAAVLTDRSNAIRAERQLELAARLEAVGSLTAGIAHEVNNPLAYVQANLNLIEKLIAELNQRENAERLSEPLRDLVADGAESVLDVRDGIERISLLVARLKGFAREPADLTALAALDLGTVAERAIAVAGVGLPDDAIRAHSELSEEVLCNEHAVVQILVNLILNAIQASDGTPDVEITVREAGDTAELRVSDRGRGLNEESIDRIFDPFFTTKASGTGLGLSVSYDLARRLGARLEAEAREGGGAVFSLFLPRTHPDAV
jgi:signal transduction histidine kinase